MVSIAFGVGVEDSTSSTTAEDANNMIVDPSNFVETIDNPYFPLNPGTKFIYETDNEDKLTETVYVTNETKEVLGVSCVVVTSIEIIDDELSEISSNWYAQDKDGNVWAFGEDTADYENGVADRGGSWEAGIDDAKPVIVMKADPQVGDSYKGEDADMAEVINLTASVSVPYGSFDNCLMVKEGSTLDETGSFEYSYYVQEIGLVLGIDGSERKELVNVETF